jgi:hypothetical protein
MKTNQINQLKEIIRAIVRKEAKSIIQEEVSKAMGKVLVEMVKEIKNPIQPKPLVNEAVEEEFQEEPEVATIKTNNPLLSSALADTAKRFRGMPRSNTGPLVELAEGFEKVGVGDTGIEEPMTNMNFMKQMIAENTAVGPTPQSVLDCKEELPDHLAKLFSGKNLGNRFKKVKESAGSAINNGQVGMI